MKTIQSFKKITNIDYFYAFLTVIFLGNATVFTQGGLESFSVNIGSGIESFIGKALMFALSLLVLFKHKIDFSICIEKAIAIFVVIGIWGVLQFVKYDQFSAFPLARIMNVYFSIVIILCYRKKIIFFLEDILSKLALIDFVLWIFLLIMPDFINNLLSLSPIEGTGLVKGNSLVIFASGRHYELFIRNIGFAWEPGRFGSIMAIAVFFNLVVNRFRLKKNKNFIFLSLAVLSSQSTTAYFIYLTDIAFYLYNKKANYFVGLLPIFLVLSFVLLQLDFMVEKVQDLSIFNKEHNDAWQSSMDYYSRNDMIIVPQRFDALYMEFLNILHDPLLGNATDTYTYLYGKFGVKFSLSNGALRIFANMGILIGIWYYIQCYRASKWMSITYNYKGTFAFFILFLLMNISYSWIFEPIFLSFVLYPFILGNNKLYQLYGITGKLRQKSLKIKLT